MNALFREVVRFYARKGVPISMEQAANQLRYAFDGYVPALMRRGHPIPVTDEGKFLVLEVESGGL